MQHVCKSKKFFRETFRSVVVMMEVHLDVSKSLARQSRDGVEVFRQVFFFGIEKRVLRRRAFGVVVPRRNHGILGSPRLHTSPLNLEVRPPPSELDAVGYR